MKIKDLKHYMEKLNLDINNKTKKELVKSLEDYFLKENHYLTFNDY